MAKNKNIFDVEIIKKLCREKDVDVAGWFFTYKGEVYGDWIHTNEVPTPATIRESFEVLTDQAAYSMEDLEKKDKK